MRAIYQITITPEVFDTMSARYRAHVKNRKPLIRFQALIFVALAAFVGYGFYIHAHWTTPVTTVTVITGAMFLAKDQTQVSRWRARKALSDKPLEFTLVLNEDELRVSTATSDTVLMWPTQTNASRFRDGFILEQGNLFRWLPDTALTGATVSEVASLLRARVSDYRTID